MTDFPDLSQFDRIAIDTETTGLTDLDRPVGLSLYTPDDRDFYFAWGHGHGGNNTSATAVIDWLQTELRRNPSLQVVMHNAGYDMRMLAYQGLDWRGVRVEDSGTVCALLNELEPSFSLDSLGEKYTGLSKQDDALNDWCAQQFGGKPTRKTQAKHYWQAPADIVGPYAKFDARMTYKLHEVRRPLITSEGLEAVLTLEDQLIHVLHRMHMVGVRVARSAGESTRADLLARYEASRAEWDALSGGLNINSTKQLADFFRAQGWEIWKTPTETRDDGTTSGGNDSIPKELLEKLAKQGVRAAQLILDQRQLLHYANTFIENYVLKNAREHDIVHGEFHPVKNEKYGTVSGRLSSGGALNLQNVPARDAQWAPLIRGLYVPYYDGQQWAKFDYSQIEYRFLAHYAGGSIMRTYVDDPSADFHQMVADMTGIPRSPAKTLNFALVYGQGVKATAEQLGITVEEARVFQDAYNAQVPEVRETYDLAMRRAEDRGYIVTWGGRKRRFPPHPFRKGKFDRTHKGLNALLQGSAADLIKYSMVRVAEAIDWEDCILHLTVHDELDFSFTPGARGHAMLRDVKQIMEDFTLRVPVIADCEVGPDWGHVEEVDVRQLGA